MVLRGSDGGVNRRVGCVGSGDVGLGNAAGMTGWPLDQLDPVAEDCVQPPDLDDEVVDAGAEIDLARPSDRSTVRPSLS